MKAPTQIWLLLRNSNWTWEGKVQTTRVFWFSSWFLRTCLYGLFQVVIQLWTKSRSEGKRSFAIFTQEQNSNLNHEVSSVYLATITRAMFSPSLLPILFTVLEKGKTEQGKARQKWIVGRELGNRRGCRLCANRKQGNQPEGRIKRRRESGRNEPRTARMCAHMYEDGMWNPLLCYHIKNNWKKEKEEEEEKSTLQSYSYHGSCRELFPEQKQSDLVAVPWVIPGLLQVPESPGTQQLRHLESAWYTRQKPHLKVCMIRIHELGNTCTLVGISIHDMNMAMSRMPMS